MQQLAGVEFRFRTLQNAVGKWSRSWLLIHQMMCPLYKPHLRSTLFSSIEDHDIAGILFMIYSIVFADRVSAVSERGSFGPSAHFFRLSSAVIACNHMQSFADKTWSLQPLTTRQTYTKVTCHSLASHRHDSMIDGYAEAKRSVWTMCFWVRHWQSKTSELQNSLGIKEEPCNLW